VLAALAGAREDFCKDCALRQLPLTCLKLLLLLLLLLLPSLHHPQNVSTAIAPDLSTYFTLTDLNSFRTSRAAMNATFTALQRRLGKLDPWLPVDTQVTPGGFYPLASDGGSMVMPQAAAVDIPDAKYLAGMRSSCGWGCWHLGSIHAQLTAASSACMTCTLAECATIMSRLG
jgi:hypothetical protein